MGRSWISQTRKGTTELVVLAALTQGEAYGYEILGRLSTMEGFAFTESTVYPVLARLAAQDLLSARVAPSPKGPKRRYYRLTPEGRQRLQEMRAHFRLLLVGIEALSQTPREET